MFVDGADIIMALVPTLSWTEEGDVQLVQENKKSEF